MKLIDKSALVDKIKKRLLPVIRDKHYDEWEEGQDSERIAILDIINTLEVKEVDLEFNKLYKQGWKDAFAKASIFVYQLATAFPDTSYMDVDKIRDDFKQYMEEQQ